MAGQFGGEFAQEWNVEGLVAKLSLPVERLVATEEIELIRPGKAARFTSTRRKLR